MADRAPETPARLAEEGERLYRLLANHSADVFAVFDLEGRAIYVSPSVHQLRGYMPEECLLQGPEERLTPHSQEVVRQAFVEVLALEQAGQTPPNSAPARPQGRAGRRGARAATRALPPGVELVTRLRDGLPRLEADRTQLEHVLRQLVTNACDAMPEGGRIIVETAASAVRGAPPGAVLSVADTGHGMSEEVRARAFEPFFTTKDVGAGTGLGLAMVYGSVQQHGGRLEMDSAPGVGTTVRIHLPAAVPGASRAGTDATVLVVEEDRATADRLVEVLGGCGYRVLAAPGAEEALAVASLHPGAIDLLISDVMLARLNGAELAARLRQARPALRTLFVVEDVREPDPRLVLHAPEDWLVHRRFSAESLLEKVARVLQTPAAAQAERDLA